MINFKADVFKIGSWTLLVLPESASKHLSSRGMVLVEGTINGHRFKKPLEPDGRGSHWLAIDQAMQKAAGISAGDTAELKVEQSKDWPEPTLPKDVAEALAKAPDVQELWADITPAARWDWLRWIASTGKSETRAKHIKVAFSKLRNGTRRPCCFNRALSTVPEVSKGGALLEPVNN
ncbi:MAG TPA: YdeI/OmpD-associated family protein [Candidatus Saccharimonadales bacterium]|nr:YdeI/OmpD-associated family protein [Candidatus Saccharimonadales bacterium]